MAKPSSVVATALPGEGQKPHGAAFEDAEIADIGRALTLCNGGVEILLPDSDEELAEQIAVGIARDARNMAETAFRIAALKSRAGHGNYLPVLARLGIGRDMAERYLKLACFLLALPERHRPRFIGMSVSKAPALASLSSDELAAAAESGELDELAALPREILVKRLKKQDTTVEALQTKLEAKTAAYDKLKHHLAHRHDHLQMPEFAAVAREESAALTEKMLACLDSLDELMQQYLLASRDEPEAERFQAAAAGTLYHALLPAVARGHELLRVLDEAYGEDVTATVKFNAQLIKAEAAHYLKMRSALLEQHAREARNREALRENAKAGKRGRKRTVETE